ncbi:aminotransferase-like domain-containing protein [Pedobacter nutrimenti]|jgi:GntR family transcriptional regulator/MocR family aminotransferase|uniref:GntR family transcriptional regulator/MocR family aminotransferase n=1 Tax=Pedobacter nutrimenti TaxID=1241337 RepID=A0A318UB74_9SPHI|nr:PLP-dependent aminotransferase family protein [Pedobacter nutrimenti]PYF72851.1 GntR family transcriptional regulator/MocR family aminotransferase [Pedobacter nutrimenti]
MSSPVKIPFKSLIHLDRTSGTAVYLQIAYQLINAIQRGVLVPGIQLPGSRLLSESLEVHRKTVIAAYDELDAQGWTEIRPNKGTFIGTKSPVKEADPLKYNKEFLASYPQSTGYAFKKSMLLDLPQRIKGNGLEFTDGLPDVRLAPLDQLSRVYGTNLKRRSNQKYLGYSSSEGSDYFKEMLAAYLNNTRGLHISKNNVMTTRGIDMGIYLAADLLLEAGDLVVVGDLSYYVANMIFQKAGARMISVPVDEDGISVDAVRQLCKKHKIRMLYLTPHHHYPTTVTLSAKKRLELLSLSVTYGFIILEDDYDYDFHYSSSPVLPLASADGNGMVVYIGSFCKSLAPGFRSGYLVAPENLITELSKLRGIVDRQGDVLMEQALAELLEEGEVQRHLKKALKIYHERRDIFCELLKSQLEQEVSFSAPPGGLAMWTRWKPGLNLMRISKNCAARDLYLPQTLLYQTESVTAMRLGFGNLSVKELESSVEILTWAVKKN